MNSLSDELNDNRELLEMLQQGLRLGHTQCYSIGHQVPDGSIWYSLGVAKHGSDWLRATDRMSTEGDVVVSIVPLGTIQHLAQYMGLIPTVQEAQ